MTAHVHLNTARRMSLQLLLATGLLLSASLNAGDQATYEAQMKELQQNIQQLQQQLQKVHSSRDELEQELQKSESEIGELLKKIDTIQRQLREQEGRLQSLNQERDHLQKARREQQQQAAEQVRTAYQLGQQSQLKLLLNQESPERVTRLLKYHDYFLSARSDKITAYINTIAQLDALAPRIQRQTEELQASQQQLRQRHQLLSQRQNERQQTLAKLNASATSTDQELKQRNRDRDRLQALLDEMTSAIAALPLPGGGERFSSRRGKLPWPAEGRVAHRFGSTRIAGQLQWNGILIDAPAGRPVLAVHHGRVVFSDYFRGHGLLVILDHGEGFMSLYAHNQTLLKETGDWVGAGEAIASVGNSGGQARTGLYFEIRQGGKPTDPGPWLARA